MTSANAAQHGRDARDLPKTVVGKLSGELFFFVRVQTAERRTWFADVEIEDAERLLYRGDVRVVV